MPTANDREVAREAARATERLLAKTSGGIGIKTRRTPVGLMITQSCLVCRETSTLVHDGALESILADDAADSTMLAWMTAFAKLHVHEEKFS